MGLNKSDKKRMEELTKKLKDADGNYKADCDFEELQELAVLEAKADGQLEPPVVPYKDEVDKKEQRFTNEFTEKKKAPKILKKWIDGGHEYCGVDKDGVFIMYNRDEGMFYRFIIKPMNTPDLLAEKLEKKYLDSLK